MKIRTKLLLKFFFEYPLYYVIAMFIAVLILAPIMDWGFIFAKKLFFILAIIMWGACYFIHFDIFMQFVRRKD